MLATRHLPQSVCRMIFLRRLPSGLIACTHGTEGSCMGRFRSSSIVLRGRQVLLPVEPDARLPEWILDRTPTEVKAAYAAAIRKREQGQARPDSRARGS